MTTGLPPTHACPGCRAPGIPRNRLSCPPCWRRLPLNIRWRLNATHGLNKAEHRIAVQHAIRWYREHQHMRKQQGDLDEPQR